MIATVFALKRVNHEPSLLLFLPEPTMILSIKQ